MILGCRTTVSSVAYPPIALALNYEQLLYLQSFLVAISFFNALWLFLSKKNYRMLHRDRSEKPLASNVRMVEVQQDETHWSFKYPGKLV
jgi:hypothetical protein